MIAVDKREQTTGISMIWVAVALALSAAASYLLMAWDLLGAGDLGVEEAPDGIVYVAAGCYLVGGLLILLRRRGLWIAGAVINALVMLVFFNFYAERPAVLFSPGGIASKAAQLVLEIGLIHLIVDDWRAQRKA